MFSRKCEPPPVRSGEILYVAISALICSSPLGQPSFDVDPEKGPFQKESYIILDSLLRDHTENNYPSTSNTNQRMKESLVWNLYIVYAIATHGTLDILDRVPNLLQTNHFFVTNILARKRFFLVAPRIQNAKK